MCNYFSSVQSFSCVRLSATPWTAARQASLSITNSRSSPKSMSIELVMLSNHLIFCHPLLPRPSIFPSIRDFSNGSTLCIRWPKDWSFSFNISPTNENPVLISIRMIFSTELMKFRLSVFCEVVRTLAEAQDEKVLKVDKEETKNSPRETLGLKREFH